MGFLLAPFQLFDSDNYTYIPHMSSIDDIVADFSFLDNWEDRYRYVIELGRALEPIPDVARNDANKVRGCASQVWLDTTFVDGPAGRILHFTGDSDALIVRGLVAVALAIFNDKPPQDIRQIDAEAIFTGLQLREHLTAQRSNGLRALVDRIKADAARAES